MDACDDFTRYLAQAYECRHVIALEGRAAALYAAAAGEPDLIACHIPSADTCALQEGLQAVACAMDRTAIGLVTVETAGEARAAVRHLAQRALAEAQLNVAFVGCVRARSDARDACVAVVHREADTCAPTASAPEHFRVLAVVPTYNEADVISQTLRDLVAQGIDVHVLDNWSTDETAERAHAFLGQGVVAVERFPPAGPARTYELSAILARVEQIAEHARWASWAMLHDADERRRCPWPGVTMRDALWHVDRCGFSCVDHVTLNFAPIDESFDPDGTDLEQHFEHFEFSTHPGHFHQRRAWKQLGPRVALVPSAGHDVRFRARRVYPYKFLLKHYPIRSQAHGERKVLLDRRPRWNALERACHWHRQYDALPRGGFVRDPATLTRFVAQDFTHDYMIERLSGVGIFRRPPPWATPPSW